MKSVITLALAAAMVALSVGACGPGIRRAVPEDRIGRLKRDVSKVRFAIRTTKTLVARARGAKYQPDLFNRLAELYVEQARYHYQISVEKQKVRSAGVVSVQARLLKNQAIATYRRLLALFPKYPDGDKVMFFMGHEMRELGEYDKMLTTYQELSDKYPKSKYRLEALLVMGDYYFDKAKLDDAEKYYRKVIESPEARVHAMARYKLAWCRINRADFKGALKLFEGSVDAARKWLAKTGGRSRKGSKIDLRREALVDSVFCFTEVHKPKGSLSYFKRRADSKTTYLAALHKLGNRYYVKQNWKATAMVYREILNLAGDVEDALEYAHRLYEAVSQGKLFDHGADDVRALINVIRRRSYNHELKPKKRKTLMDSFEKYARYIATKLQDLANEKKDRDIYLQAAEAYKAYLTFFADHQKASLVRANLAEVFYAAKEFIDAGTYYERAARLQTGKSHQDSVYTAVVAYFEALKGKNKLTRLEVVRARAGLRRAGRIYIRKYAKADPEKTRQVKFNIARTYYDAGEFDDAIRLYTAFVNQYPTSKEAPNSAHLVLDAYRSREDYEGLIEAGKTFAKMSNLGGAQFKSEVAAIVKGAEDALLRTETIKASDDSGEDKLDAIARKYRGTSLGKKALLNKFATAQNSKDPEKIFTVGEEFLRAYPSSKDLTAVLSTMGKIATASLQFARGARYLEAAGRRNTGSKAQTLYQAACEIRASLGQANKAEQDFSVLLRSGMSAGDKASLAVRIARLYIQANDWSGMIRLLKRAVSAGASSPQMNYLLGYALYRTNDLQNAVQFLGQAVQGGKGGSADDKEAAAAAQFYLGEVTFKTFKAVQLSSDLSKLGPSLQQKLGYLGQTRTAYKGVVSIGSAIWSVAALGRLAAVDKEAADALTNLALPSGLPANVQQQVKAALASNAKPLIKEAGAALKQCAKTALKLKVLSDAAKACISGQPPETDPQARSAPTVTRTRPRGAKKLQRHLAVQPKDLRVIVKLGAMYISSGNAYMARMILGKGLEIRPSALILNLIGVATQRLGEDQEAFDYFDKALKRDSGYRRAHANMAALLLEYGYKAAAKKHARRARVSSYSDDDPGLIPGAAAKLKGMK
ncbi:MAG: tetratricopeptide repeat protein [Myxococcales bacterium]|nr:tetratricopeptide repeat protein [Myxococcales bacterium]